jgi:hypothetical protein
MWSFGLPRRQNGLREPRLNRASCRIKNVLRDCCACEKFRTDLGKSTTTYLPSLFSSHGNDVAHTSKTEKCLTSEAIRLIWRRLSIGCNPAYELPLSNGHYSFARRTICASTTIVRRKATAFAPI